MHNWRIHFLLNGSVNNRKFFEILPGRDALFRQEYWRRISSSSLNYASLCTHFWINRLPQMWSVRWSSFSFVAHFRQTNVSNEKTKIFNCFLEIRLIRRIKTGDAERRKQKRNSIRTNCIDQKWNYLYRLIAAKCVKCTHVNLNKQTHRQTRITR